ncbi:MAG: fatty acid desaturase [Chthoniobacteraceae bacterium]
MNNTGTPEPPSTRNPKQDTAAWKAIVLKFQEPSLPRAIWQLVNTLGPFAGLWYLMWRSMSWSYWITLPLAVLAGLFLVRIFIIFHDCGHGSFFKSRLANDILGFITGALTLTPYYHWRWEHSIHHATSGALDRRGVGDVWTMTVEEYLQSGRWKRFAYQLARNPFVLFGIAPVFLFVFYQRIYSSKASSRERWSVIWMNVAVLGIAVALSSAFAIGRSWGFGITAYLLIHLTITMVGGGVGIWMFYVQHQFEDVYWERDESWDYTSAALEGSSFYKLPRILQWFSGNIGFHHIHHLSSRIPNYNLERCHEADPMFRDVKPLTFFNSLKSLTYRLWDEQRGRLVGFRHARQLRKERRAAQAAEAEREAQAGREVSENHTQPGSKGH